MRKGLIFIVSAPSGSGKTTICNRVLEEVDNLEHSVSLTTRKPRAGERNKKDYHYTSPESFKEEIKKGNLLEWEKNFGYSYGTPKSFVLETIKKGKDVLLNIDVRGARQVKKAFPESILIFIKPPSFEELARRLRTRNTDESCEIEKRLKLAEEELKAESEYDHVVVNEKLEEAINEIIFIIKKEGGK